MLTLHATARFRKDYKLARRRNIDLAELQNVVDTLLECQKLPERYLGHPLHGEWEGFRECHIKPDWLLIYAISCEKLVLVLARTGIHSDLFEK